MDSNLIRIIWLSSFTGNSGHGEYMKLVGTTPQELVKKLNDKHPGIHHWIEPKR